MDTTSIEEDISTFSQYLGYIEKSLKHKKKYAMTVVEKVIADYQDKMLLLSREIGPKLASVREASEKFHSELDKHEQEKQSIEDSLQEFQLRREIGALDEDTYKSESQDIANKLTNQNKEIETLQGELARLTSILDRWDVLRQQALDNEEIELNGLSDSATSNPILPEPSPEPEAVETKSLTVDVVDAEIIDDVDLFTEAPEPMSNQDLLDGLHFSDVSEPIEEQEEEIEEDLLGEPMSVNQDSNPLEAQVSGFDSLDQELGESISDLQSPLPPPNPSVGTLIEEDNFNLPPASKRALGDSLEVDMGLDIQLETELGKGEFPLSGAEQDQEDLVERSAMLVYNEGSPDEKLIPLSEEIFTIGRSVGNNYKIKNDSKVSRKHCQIYRKGSIYYIEDLNSSNGTYVGGELISERPLYGGEQLKVGECVFTFRLQ